MLKSRVITVPIIRSYKEVYGFLGVPENLLVWGAVDPGAKMEHVVDNDYLVDLPSGRLVMRFSPINEYGVLDFQVFPQGPPAALLRRCGCTGTTMAARWFTPISSARGFPTSSSPRTPSGCNRTFCA